MIQRDILLRQVQQLAQILAQVLFHKKEEQVEEAQALIAQGLVEMLGLDVDDLRTRSRDELQALFSDGSRLVEATAIAVADLLREDATEAGRRRALWLYELALHEGATVPYDVVDRIDALRASLADEEAPS